MALEKFFLCGHFQPEARSVLGLLDYPDSYRFLIHLLFSAPGSERLDDKLTVLHVRSGGDNVVW